MAPSAAGSQVAPAPAPMPNHESLHAAIERMQEVNYHLSHLIRKISGENAPDTKDGPSISCPSLKDVLECSTSEINDRVNEAHAQIDSIESLLF